MEINPRESYDNGGWQGVTAGPGLLELQPNRARQLLGFLPLPFTPIFSHGLPSDWGRPEKCCLGRGELDERGKYHF